MAPHDQGHSQTLAEGGDLGLAEGDRHAAVAEGPAARVGVRPDEVADESVRGDEGGPRDLPSVGEEEEDARCRWSRATGGAARGRRACRELCR